MSLSDIVSFGTDAIAADMTMLPPLPPRNRSSAIIDQGLNRGIRDRIANYYENTTAAGARVAALPSVVHALHAETQLDNTRRHAEQHYNIGTNSIVVPRMDDGGDAEGFKDSKKHKSEQGLFLGMSGTTLLLVLVFVLVVVQYHMIIQMREQLRTMAPLPQAMRMQ